jgi:hypothetical protein
MDRPKRPIKQKSEECEEQECPSLEDKNLKLIKIKMNKLVPLTIDKIKERMKML